MVARIVVIGLVLAACGRTPSVPAPVAPVAVAPAPAARCLADEIGELDPTGQQLECTSDREACHKACIDGDGNACLSLAYVVQFEDADRDSEQIRGYFERACRAGLAPGCTNWAAALWVLDAERVSWRCLYRLFEKSCDSGEPFGCGMTARMLVEEPRTPFDRWIAYSQLATACDKLEGAPCRFLALYIERGVFGQPNPARVKVLLERACRGQDVDACGKTTAAATMH